MKSRIRISPYCDEKVEECRTFLSEQHPTWTDVTDSDVLAIVLDHFLCTRVAETRARETRNTARI